MCGIVGFWEVRNSDSAVACQHAEKMANTIAHRGPDDDGIWHDQQESLVLAHRRLSILDLSPAGRQPMQPALECSTGQGGIAFLQGSDGQRF